jgi:DNA polymerase-3 subunit delta'
LWNTIGHEKLINHLEQVIAAGRISHAYIFYGPEHVGKTTCALDLARAVNCTNQTTISCGECQQCLRIIKEMHADIHVVSPERSDNKTSIGISDIRDVLHSSNMKPYEGSYRVTIIDEAECMTEEASNALLKTLEEPPDQNLFFLITSQESKLLSTIKSRCQLLYFSNITKDIIREYLSSNYSLDPQKLELITSLSRGRLGWAIRAMRDEAVLNSRATSLELFWELHRNGLDSGFSISENMASDYFKNPKSIFNTLEHWHTLFRDIMIVKHVDNIYVHNIDVYEQIEEMSKKYLINNLIDNISLILNASDQLKANVIPRLVLDNLVLKLHKN